MTLPLDRVLLQASPVLPVLVIEDVALAPDLARALYAGGVTVLEVTLRTPQALDAIAAIHREVPEVLLGGGYLIHTEQFLEARDAGAQFAVSPGCTPRLAAAAEDAGLPYLPGVMTPSEVLLALEYGYRSLKLFPADGTASVKMLKSLKGPFTGIRFCPTGGVNLDNLLNFLRLPNVACVGGTWLAPPSLIRARAWDQITQLARKRANWPAAWSSIDELGLRRSVRDRPQGPRRGHRRARPREQRRLRQLVGALRLAPLAAAGPGPGRVPPAGPGDGGAAPRDRLPGRGLRGRRTATGDLDRRVRPAPADEPALPVGTPGGWRHAAAGADHLRLHRTVSGKPKRMPAEFIDGYGQALLAGA